MEWTRHPRSRLFRRCLLLAGLVHVLGLWTTSLSLRPEPEEVAFRVQLSRPFAPTAAQPASTPAQPEVDRTLRSRGVQPGAPRPWHGAAMAQGPGGGGMGPGWADAVAGAPTSLRGFGADPAGVPGADARAGGLHLAQEHMPSPTAPGRTGAPDGEPLELLDMVTLARARGTGASVVPDPRRPRDLRGFVYFANLLLEGVGSYEAALVPCGRDTANQRLRIPSSEDSCVVLRPVLAALAEYLSHGTGLVAGVRPGTARTFAGGALLRDPIHFLFPLPTARSGLHTIRVELSDEEVKALGEYLRGGGFVVVEGEPDSPAIVQVLTYVHQALHGQGRLRKLPFAHPLYHAFCSFDAGFPGERTDQVPEGGASWLPPWPRTDGLRQGVWGVEWDGHLVGVACDLCLYKHWWDAQEEPAVPAAAEDGGAGAAPPEPALPRAPFLRAGANLVAYALTRPGSLAQRRAAPAWVPPAPTAPVPEISRAPEAVDGEVLADLGADLAAVALPLGRQVGDRPVCLVVDGLVSLEVTDGVTQGLRLRHLPAGRHRVALRWGRQQRTVAVDLLGGYVLTLGFRRRAWPLGMQVEVVEGASTPSVWDERYGALRVQDDFWPDGER